VNQRCRAGATELEATAVVVQSGWPGIGGVFAPYSQSFRNDRRSWPETRDARAMKSCVEADLPRYLATQARSRRSKLLTPIFCRSANRTSAPPSYTLGLKTSQIESDRNGCATGPYRVLRHPSYTGLLLVLVGIGLLLGNWLSLLAVAVAATAALVYRIGVEERALEAALGDRYREYAATRKRLIPYVW